MRCQVLEMESLWYNVMRVIDAIRDSARVNSQNSQLHHVRRYLICTS